MHPRSATIAGHHRLRHGAGLLCCFHTAAFVAGIVVCFVFGLGNGGVPRFDAARHAAP